MLQKLFGFRPGIHKKRTEIMAGITTFLVMAYILAIVPNVVSSTGMDKGALFTTTVLASVTATLFMSLYAKLPFALGPGIGLMAFFTYTVCLSMGYSWQYALTAVFIEGIVFILLTLTNLREKLLYALPLCLRNSIGSGIGLFVAFLGLENSGLVIDSEATLVTLGNVTSGSGLLCLIGLVITSILLARKVNGALLYGIILTTLIGIPMGQTQLNGVFSLPPSISPIAFHLDWENIFTKDMVLIVFTFLFVDLFDTIGTLVGVSSNMEEAKPKDTQPPTDHKIPWIKKAFFADAVGTTVGALLGSTTITTFVESTAGVGAGGRTGLTSFITAVCFLVSLFLAPFFLSIPAAATAPALILVGLMMMGSIKRIPFDDYTESIPAYLCILMIPLTYNIANGIAIGVISYVLINVLSGNYRKVTAGNYILAAILVVKYLL